MKRYSLFVLWNILVVITSNSKGRGVGSYRHFSFYLHHFRGSPKMSLPGHTAKFSLWFNSLSFYLLPLNWNVFFFSVPTFHILYGVTDLVWQCGTSEKCSLGFSCSTLVNTQAWFFHNSPLWVLCRYALKSAIVFRKSSEKVVVVSLSRFSKALLYNMTKHNMIYNA